MKPEELKRRREELGITQDELAERLDGTDGRLERIENQLEVMTLDVMDVRPARVAAGRQGERSGAGTELRLLSR